MSSQGLVLLAEDEPALRRVIERVPTGAGYEVATAADGATAAELLAERTFDVVVSDIDMPRLTGIQLLELVRKRDLEVPVVLMTGAPDLKTARDAVTHGALDYLTKPLDLDELDRVVSSAVRLSRIARLKRDALALINGGGLGVADRLALGSGLDRALETLWMAYQPIVSVSGRSVFAYEALLRSDDKTLPHPGAILDAAERLGRLPELGRAIRGAASNSFAAAPPDVLLFVNLHARDLADPGLRSPDAPLSAIASRVVLEITERASLDEVKDARARIADLREIGFMIAIDDLGAGYAGLTSFATLQPEIVKLDMSLIRDVDRDSTRQKLVRSMTALCKDLGMTVVAEGVETTAERDTLTELGCDLLQGYLFARPGRPFPDVAW